MRRVLLAAMFAAVVAGSAGAADNKNLCPEGPVTLTGTIGINRLFDPPDLWVAQSEPCRVHLIEIDKAEDTCTEGAKISVTGKVEQIKEDGEVSLVQISKPEKLTCTKN